MNYILLNADGSVKRSNFTEIITQNSDGVSEIFVSVADLDTSTHSANGIFVLPDGSASVEFGEVKSNFEFAPSETADGYLITLTQSETALAGVVRLTIQVKNTSTQKVLYTYRVPLTINSTADLNTYVNITIAQYNNLLNYIDTFSPTNLVPYTGAVNDLVLGEHSLFAANAIFGNDSEGNYIQIEDDYIIVLKDYHETDFLFPDTGNVETLAVKSQLPKQGVCAAFSTGTFTYSEDHYVANNIPLSNFIAGSNMIIITWDNCFALCPIPQSGAGRVCAAMWDANGEAKTIRIRYELKENNTKLDINLQGGFTPPSNHTAYVQCIKLFSE